MDTNARDLLLVCDQSADIYNIYNIYTIYTIYGVYGVCTGPRGVVMLSGPAHIPYSGQNR